MRNLNLHITSHPVCQEHTQAKTGIKTPRVESSTLLTTSYTALSKLFNFPKHQFSNLQKW